MPVVLLQQNGHSAEFVEESSIKAFSLLFAMPVLKGNLTLALCLCRQPLSRRRLARVGAKARPSALSLPYAIVSPETDGQH